MTGMMGGFLSLIVDIDPSQVTKLQLLEDLTRIRMVSCNRGVVRLLIAVLFVVFCALTPTKANDVKYFNVIEKLHANLLENYNKQIIPVLNPTQALLVDASMKLTHFDYDDAHSSFFIRGFFAMSWNDPRFAWSPDDYEGVESVHVPSDLIWIPDLEVYNTNGDLSDERHFATNTMALITSTGTVYFVPLTNFKSVCYPNLSEWPYDTQDCSVKLGSWTYNANKMKILPQNNETTVSIREMFGSGSANWNLLKTSVDVIVKIYECCPEPYQSLTYSFTVQRKSVSAKFTIIAPTFVIVALTLATFFIPPNVGAKLIVGMVDVCLLCAYLIHFSSVIPSNESAAPFIVSFYGSTLILVAVSIITNIATFSWTRFPKTHPPPAFIRKFLTCCSVRCLLGITALNQKTEEEEKLAEKKEILGNEIIQQHWMNLSLALNRLMFSIYCIVFAVLVKCCVF